MWTLDLPDSSDAMANIDTAFNYKYKGVKHAISLDEKKIVFELYKNYDRRRGIGHNDLKALSLRKELLDAFEDSYKEVQAKGRLKDLRNRLFLDAGRCPCCGILPVDELDHHLPKSTFKVLSIYSSNIIPYCHVCNKRKLDSEGNVPTERFIHAYYDPIPQKEQFLIADVWIEGRGLQCKLKIEKTLGMTEEMKQRLDFQLKKVELDTRILGELFDYLIPLDFDDTFQSGGAKAVMVMLKKTGERLKDAYGLNDWRPVVIKALSNCSDFCEGGFYRCLFGKKIIAKNSKSK